MQSKMVNQYFTLVLLTTSCCQFSVVARAQTPIIDLASVRPLFEDFFEQRRIQQAPYGQYRLRAGDTAPSYYGSLDVAISRAIMGENLMLSLTDTQRSQWITHLQSFANPDGTFDNDYGHHQLHRNGMTIGGLGVLGGKQLYPVTRQYAPFDEVDEVPDYLENSINWIGQWGESHKFWGGFHMFSQSSQSTPQWNAAVFQWLDANVDPDTGWWRIGAQPSDVHGLGGGAHIWPMYEHLGHDFPYPERVIDRILGMQVSSGRFGGNDSGYMDLDALYGLKYMRSLAPGYRQDEVDQSIEDFGVWLAGNLNSFLNSSPNLHEVLAKVGGFGLLNQLAPEKFPDSTGVQWTDIFTDQNLYQTAAVETFTVDAEPIGQDSPSNYAHVVLAAGPVGYWRLGQTGGVVAPDATGDSKLFGVYVGMDGTSAPGSLAEVGPRPTNGFDGHSGDNRAPRFDGQGSYVSVPDQPTLDVTGAITMEAWIRLDELPEKNGGILAKYVGARNQRSYQIYVNNQGGVPGALGMVISPDGTFSGATTLVDDRPLPIDQWIHVVGVFEPDQFMRLYVNGELAEQHVTDVPSDTFDSDSDLWIGRQYSSASEFHFPGSIDEVAVYARALTGEEVISHYRSATKLAGDYNQDGLVDLGDYTVWRDSLASKGERLDGADGDGDALVTAADYEVWRNHFGRSSGPRQLFGHRTVPEPSSFIFGVLLGVSVSRLFGQRHLPPLKWKR